MPLRLFILLPNNTEVKGSFHVIPRIGEEMILSSQSYIVENIIHDMDFMKITLVVTLR